MGLPVSVWLMIFQTLQSLSEVRLVSRAFYAFSFHATRSICFTMDKSGQVSARDTWIKDKFGHVKDLTFEFATAKMDTDDIEAKIFGGGIVQFAPAKDNSALSKKREAWIKQLFPKGLLSVFPKARKLCFTADFGE